MLTVVHDAEGSGDNGGGSGSLLDDVVRNGTRRMAEAAALNFGPQGARVAPDPRNAPIFVPASDSTSASKTRSHAKP
jgi:hypothetical protein